MELTNEDVFKFITKISLYIHETRDITEKYDEKSLYNFVRYFMSYFMSYFINKNENDTANTNIDEMISALTRVFAEYGYCTYNIIDNITSYCKLNKEMLYSKVSKTAIETVKYFVARGDYHRADKAFNEYNLIKEELFDISMPFAIAANIGVNLWLEQKYVKSIGDISATLYSLKYQHYFWNKNGNNYFREVSVAHVTINDYIQKINEYVRLNPTESWYSNELITYLERIKLII